MAVYKRTYTRYTGNLTNERWRFTILARYAIKTIFESKVNTILFMIALLNRPRMKLPSWVTMGRLHSTA